MVHKKPVLRLIKNKVSEKIEYEEEMHGELRTPIEKFCLKLTRNKPPKTDGKIRSSTAELCSFIYSVFTRKSEAQAFDPIKGTLGEMCTSLYSFCSEIIPKGKSPEQQAEETLTRMGWTQQQLQDVRVLEMQMKAQ